MEASARLYLCARCRCQVVICSHCDRGQRYCTDGCAERARQSSLREAGQRYQRSRRGRHCHAARQRRYRQRQREKMTHQGSPVMGGNASLKASPQRPANVPNWVLIDSKRCSFCGRLCSVFLRLGFIRRRHRRRNRSSY